MPAGRERGGEGGGGVDLCELHSFAPSSLWNTEQQLNSTLDANPERQFFNGECGTGSA